MSAPNSAQIPLLLIPTPAGAISVPLVGGDSWLIGRSQECSIMLEDRSASRHHALLQAMGGGKYYLSDLGSSNGTFINGQRIPAPTLLQHGDRLLIGQTELEFQCHIQEDMITVIEQPQKTVLMVQPIKSQGVIWRALLAAQSVAVIWADAEVDLVQFLQQLIAARQILPDLFLLDLQPPQSNLYAFCRWCQQNHPEVQICLTSSNRTEISLAERRWAIKQGALDLLPGFQEHHLVTQGREIAIQVNAILKVLKAPLIAPATLGTTLSALQMELQKDTLISP